MWTVRYAREPRDAGDGRRARLAARRRVSHAGRAALLRTSARADRLSAHGAGLDHQAAAAHRAGRRRRRFARRLHASNITFSRTRRSSMSLGLSFADLAGDDRDATMSAAARAMSSATARVSSCAAADGSRTIDDIAQSRRDRRATACRCESRYRRGRRSARELRMGSASMNGEEVVIGTALMLIGANSRDRLERRRREDGRDRQIAAARRRGAHDPRTAPCSSTPRSRPSPRISSRARRSSSSCCSCMLGNFRAALVTAMVIPVTMLLLAIGMHVGKISANLMSLGALDFGLIADGAIIVAENSLRRLAERQHAAGTHADARGTARRRSSTRRSRCGGRRSTARRSSFSSMCRC